MWDPLLKAAAVLRYVPGNWVVRVGGGGGGGYCWQKAAAVARPLLYATIDHWCCLLAVTCRCIRQTAHTHLPRLAGSRGLKLPWHYLQGGQAAVAVCRSATTGEAALTCCWQFDLYVGLQSHRTKVAQHPPRTTPSPTLNQHKPLTNCTTPARPPNCNAALPARQPCSVRTHC